MSAPLFSVIIPARNEELLLGRCLDALAEASERIAARPGETLPEKRYETIVVVNRSTDRTGEIARARGCKVLNDDSKNLSRIRNTGGRAAEGRYVLTVDADSQVSANLLSEAHRALSDARVVGGGVVIVPERWSLGILLTALCLLPIVLRHRISGGVLFCRRADFEAIGGFDENLCSVEDIDFAKRLSAHGRTDGRRFVTLWRASIRTSCRKFDRLGDWYFLFHPLKFRSLLRGHNQAEADKIWYDFER